MKLQAKVILLTMAVLTIIGIISGGTMLYFQRENSIHQFERLAAALAGAVQGSLEHAMLTGEREPVQESVSRIGTAEMVNRVMVLSANSTITVSSNQTDIGQMARQPEIRNALASGKVATWTGAQNGRGTFSVVSPVLNRPECQACHPQAAGVLGAIQVSLDTASLDSQTRQQTVFFSVSGVIALLFMGLGLTYALRRTVLKPLSSLAEPARKLSQGDYSARTGGHSDDEIGMLARTFNKMADSVEQRTRELEASRQELADWNANLEKKVEQRTAQLVALTQNLKEANKLREQLLEKLITAQEEERKRIARELHDEASQSLAALVLSLENIADALPAKYRAEKERLDVLKERAVQTLGSIRNLALELRPSVLDHLGLVKAIEWYAKDYLGKRGLEATVDTTGPKIKLAPYTETMLFRIIQEALNNTVTHARASKVSVSLKLSDFRVSVKIEDNGQGFDADSALRGADGRKNLGLHGMIERATLLGGNLDIRSAAGKGTTISIEVPYERS